MLLLLRSFVMNFVQDATVAMSFSIKFLLAASEFEASSPNFARLRKPTVAPLQHRAEFGAKTCGFALL
jgi:hypothetical protein